MELRSVSTAAIVVATVFFSLIGAARAEVEWVRLSVSPMETIWAALGVVDGGQAPAVIFHHGTNVRHLGHEAAVAAGGMDVTEYVNALNTMGYTAISPVRRHLADTAYTAGGSTYGTPSDWDSVVNNGMQVSNAARKYLSSTLGLSSDRIAIMGFSEGGNVTLWSAIAQPDYAAMVLLSPATLSVASSRTLAMASTETNLSAITEEVFVALAEYDYPSIRTVVEGDLLPNLSKLGVTVSSHLDYPGDHTWFYGPRSLLFADLRPFFLRYLH